MKKLLIPLILCCAWVCQAQVSSSTARRFRSGTTAAPATCSFSTSQVEIYYRTTTKILYICTAANTYEVIGTAGSVSPSNATYITQTANAGLSAEQAMGALATGIVKNTATTGVQSIATATDLNAPLACTDAVGTDSYACNLSPAITGYATNAQYRFKAGAANTGAATLALNGLAAITIKKVAGGITTDLADNDIRLGQVVDVVYDGSNFQMQSTLGNAGGGGGGGVTPGAARWIGPWTFYGLKWQSVIFTADAGDSTYVFNGQTTTPIAFDANAAAYQSAFEALSLVGAGNVNASGTPGEISLTFNNSIIPTLITTATNDLEFEAGPVTVEIAITDDDWQPQIYELAANEMLLDMRIEWVEPFVASATVYVVDAPDGNQTWETASIPLDTINNFQSNLLGRTDTPNSAATIAITTVTQVGALPIRAVAPQQLYVYLNNIGGAGATTGIVKVWLQVATPVAP